MTARSTNVHTETFSHNQIIWYLFCRVLVITLFLGGTIVYHLRGGVESLHPVLALLYFLFGVSFFQALVSAFLLFRVQKIKWLVQVQIAWDLLIATLLIYMSGGIASHFSFLFILIIACASIFFGRREIFVVAAASIILYGSLLDLQYYGYLPLLKGLDFPLQIDGREVFFAVFIHFIAFLSTAFLSYQLVEKLRKSEMALRKRQIDYRELENLNNAILLNITSGLMILDSEGKIQSFNHSAERITGYCLEDLFDRDFRDIFPKMVAFRSDNFRIVERDECSFVDQEGNAKIIGYSSSLLQNSEDGILGLLISFQDLTRIKEMEDKLKRSDRLAAVGQMASGMAHEIRNPLASISGSVQLLMEEGRFSDEETHLMKIVLREADRLSRLLTDFLVFARPAPPNNSEVDVSGMLDELAEMVAADTRFSKVRIQKSYPRDCLMLVDGQQIRQALWNLVINAAEAISGAGKICLGIDQETSTIFVEDSGPGIPEDIRGKIFDPFFTTKDKGSGLGLATVYTIVEQHGGSVDFKDVKGGGTRLIIFLPQAFTKESTVEEKGVFIPNETLSSVVGVG
ncbi:MAG: PAS domain S-box protein [Deltaproteobacteria bacterium]|nr:PAS domain S-box protein [Deltaproteobacteria bacterium]